MAMESKLNGYISAVDLATPGYNYSRYKEMWVSKIKILYSESSVHFD